MDFSYAIHRPKIRRVPADGLGGSCVYSQPGQPETVVDATTVGRPVDGVELEGWWADRVQVDLYSLQSKAGATLRLKLRGGNFDKGTYKTLVDRALVITPGQTSSEGYVFCVASGWLCSWFCLVAELDTGNECSFGVRYTLDRVGAGLYTDFGDGTIA